MKFYNWLLLCVVVFLQACSLEMSTGPDFSQEVDVRSSEILDTILEKKLDEVEPYLVPDFTKLEGFEETFTQIMDALPDKQNTRIKKFYTKNRVNDDKADPFPIYLTTYELTYGEKWMLVGIFVRELDGNVLLQYLTVNELDFQPSTQNEFNFSQKGFKHFAFLGLMSIVVIFILFTLYKLIRDKEIERKWLWFIFVMLGFWGLTMNWTTGELSNDFIHVSNSGVRINIIELNLLGAGFSRSGLLQPWIMEAGFPIGAIAYWFKRRARVG